MTDRSLKMIAIDRFDPFNNRLCRNVRNVLSEHFKDALEKMDMQPLRRRAESFLSELPPASVENYINRRLAAYEQVLADVCARRLEHPLDIAVSIWDRQLFFETHEYLEPYWMEAADDEKYLFQAMIRAAGAYVHLEQGNREGAERMAGKAIAGLERSRGRLAPFAEPQLLLKKLRELDPVAPKLAGTGRPD
jgi:predicted metal-dependent hydrolase